MRYRPAKAADFTNLATFVWQAIFPAFNVDGLTEAQREENDRTVAEADTLVTAALADPERQVFTAWDERRRALAGYIVIHTGRYGPAEVSQLMVRRADRRQGVGTELLRLALSTIGEGRAAYALLRPYNQVAMSFFGAHLFMDSGEAVGDFHIPRLLMYREGEENYRADTELKEMDEGHHFPSMEDEPYFEPVYESLPDHKLATEELAEWEADPVDSFLDEQQQSELNEFIVRAKAKKIQELGDSPPGVAFEIDYGKRTDGSAPTQPAAKGMGFEFAFDIAAASAPDDILELADLPKEALLTKTHPDVNGSQPLRHQKVTDPRKDFEDRLAGRLTEYFSADRLMDYLRRYRRDEDFHRIRDLALRNLSEGEKSISDRFDDLIEYFIVESAGDLHEGLFDQRILRYQTVPKEKIDLFGMVLDYLNFDPRLDRTYTDFITAPEKILRNATRNYLKASKGERLYVICDQTLTGSGRQGFAVTDRALYWKHVFQPRASAEYGNLREVKMIGGHLLINGRYFDAGHKLNLSIALLLNKLARLRARN